jgi:hypothetical protein
MAVHGGVDFTLPGTVILAPASRECQEEQKEKRNDGKSNESF